MQLNSDVLTGAVTVDWQQNYYLKLKNGIVVWAHKETGVPIRVEITLSDPENVHSVTIVMNNFDLGIELDEGLFSTKPPEDYKTATYQQLREDPASVYRR